MLGISLTSSTTATLVSTPEPDVAPSPRSETTTSIYSPRSGASSSSDDEEERYDALANGLILWAYRDLRSEEDYEAVATLGLMRQSAVSPPPVPIR